jgi:hypothetical protein
MCLPNGNFKTYIFKSYYIFVTDQFNQLYDDKQKEIFGPGRAGFGGLLY